MRKIIHIDADAFYASVEMRENPALRDKPIAVGGGGDRGVIATANYAARQFGVRSALPSARARQLCPRLEIISPRFDLYRRVSGQFREIFADFTDRIEPLSLDEAYLDVSDSEHFGGSATLIAQEIRRRVREELSLTVSAGVAPNKFLAKVASDWDKPDGQFTIAPHQVPDFVKTLPVSKINGVGRVTTEKLAGMGVVTCGDLQQVPLTDLVRRFGKYGSRLADLAHGRDDREVKTSRLRKSISVERTYSQDLRDTAALFGALDLLLKELSQRFDKIANQYLPVKRFVKVKFRDFSQTTLEEVFEDRGSSWLSTPDFQRLLLGARQRKDLPVRLLGAGLRLEPRSGDNTDQLSLFESV
ncbi:MAG: DNA polymerase IV [Halieaceae bacterium]|jgi:DNA polymerase-4|nr:DNA polymerase IV [Halieaceae bacterium]